MRRLVVRVLGRFEVTLDGRAVPAFPYAKVRALLAYLAFEGGRPLPRAQLATLLWPDQPEPKARASLNQALTSLRKVLDEKTAAEPLLLADAQSIQLNAAEVDAKQFLTLLHTADDHEHYSWRTCAACAGRLRQAMALYRGPFLEDLAIRDSDVFEEWASQQREHMRQRALSALDQLTTWAEWRGAYGEALKYARQHVAAEPFMETTQCAVMRLLALNGEPSAALAHYRHFQQLLANELATEPEEATRALFEQIQRGEIARLQAPQPPFRVPAQPTPLVNRDDEIQAICTLLRDGGTRALTITGTGGVGKTRLAIKAAHCLRYEFEDGVYVVELAALADPAGLASALAQALGVKERPPQAIEATLRDHLSTKHLLLVLDSFEHLVAAAPVVGSLILACPALKVLVTSRIPLAIRAEHQLIIEPLTEADAVQLFIERAQASGAMLPTGEAALSTIAAICQRLDGLPLAIELIAARARIHPLNELLHQLADPLAVLVGGPRDMPLRHQTLRAAIQWSYDLLGAEEQRIFRGLSVFVGGCTPEAAQAMLGEAILVASALETLQHANLIQRRTIHGQTRISMLETIRAFALEQMAAHDELFSVYPETRHRNEGV